jgi:hypothetical protein
MQSRRDGERSPSLSCTTCSTPWTTSSTKPTALDPNAGGPLCVTRSRSRSATPTGFDAASWSCWT